MLERFDYQAPSVEQTKRIIDFRTACKALAAVIESTPMKARCRALAMTKLEEVSMWGNKGIVFHDETEEDPLA